MGINVPSKVQRLVIPKMIQSPTTNFLLMASQGTGKTLAYLLPVLKRIDTSKDVTQVICVVFSCELAQQTATVAQRVALYLNKPIKIGLAIQNSKGKELNFTKIPAKIHDRRRLNLMIECIIIEKNSFPDFVVRYDRHIIFGTPKEMVAFRQMNVFDLNKIRCAIFDDADLVMGHTPVKVNIINPMPAICQQIYVSSVKMRLVSPRHVQIRLFTNDSVYPQHNDDYFIKLKNDSEKYRILRDLCKKLSLDAKAQMLIFFTVRNSFCIQYFTLLN